MPTKAYAASSAKSPLAPFDIERRAVQATDVAIDITFCGVCHSDLHQARNEWSNTVYPCVPGHEIVGRVTHVGAHVKKFKVGDLAAVGCMVDACGRCDSCKRGLEQYCTTPATYTYNSPDKHGTHQHTFGGYSQAIVVDEAFTLKVSSKLDAAATAPLLCAGITTYSPLKHWQAGPGKRVGVVGVGGLGHMGVKFARAFGAHVVVFTTSSKKVEDALRLGAHEVVLSTDKDAMKKQRGSFDFILDTVSAQHDLTAYLQCLKVDGTMTLVGLPEHPEPLGALALVVGRRQLAGSSIGSIAETQEMLDFCAEHNVVSEVENIAIQQIEEAYARLLKGDVRYRFVIDMASLSQR